MALCFEDSGCEPPCDHGWQPGLLSLCIRWTKTGPLQNGHDVALGERLHLLLPAVLRRLHCQRSGIRIASLVAARERIESRLAGRGRVVLRASGTEPLIRVMVEADDRAEAEAAALELARVVEESTT